MTHNDLIRMAEKAGFMQKLNFIAAPSIRNLEHFAELVAAFDPAQAARDLERKQAIERMASEAGWGKGPDLENECVNCAKFDLEGFARLVVADLPERKWHGLMDEERNFLIVRNESFVREEGTSYVHLECDSKELARAIEATLKERNS
jgi:hypothetical protein